MKEGQIIWESANICNRPLSIGVDNIEAVYQIGYKQNWLELFKRN